MTRRNSAETLSKKWEKLSGEHFRSAEQVRRYSSLMLSRFELQARKAIEEERSQYGDDPPFETVLETNYRLPKARDVKPWVECLAMAIDREREAISMEYQDINRAVAEVQRFGFLVTRDDGVIDVAAEFVQD